MISDPYTSITSTRERLLTEWDLHGTIIIGVDQDDTIYDYHAKGFKFTRTIDLLKRAQALGCTLCAWTADDREDYIRKQWKLLGLTMSHFNDSPITCGKQSRKPYFNILLDDRAGLGSALNLLEQCVCIKEQQ